MTLWVVAGPTASGKSRLALELAQRCGGELLCFDSTTVYRGLDIGTAKPTPQERGTCPHHLLDLVEAGQDYSLALFLEDAEKALREVQARGRQPILVGGTFLYLRAFLEGFQVPAVGPDLEFRQRAETLPLAELVGELLRLDPACRELVDLANPRRVIRALEVVRAGELFSGLYQKSPRPEPVLKIGLQPEREWLKKRILERSQAMIAAGFREEVQRLCQKGLREWLLSMRFIGYREVLEGTEQSKSDAQVATEVAESTWRLAKKQRTWGRSEAGVDWFSPEAPDLLDRVWTKLQNPTDK